MMFKRLWEDFKAKRRGEERTKPKEVRGRVYKDKNTPPSGGGTLVPARAVGTLKMKITRADGKVETIVRPVTIEDVV